MNIWQLIAAAAAAVLVARLAQLLLKGVGAWVKNARTAMAFPHTDNWSWIYGTFKKAHSGEQFLELHARVAVECTEKFKEVFAIFLGPMMSTAVTVVHPRPLQIILKETDGKAFEYNYVRPWLGDGLLLSKGAKWHRNRKLLTPAFHFSILKSYVRIMNEAADVLLAKLDDHCKSGNPYWDVAHDIGLASLDVILQCAFSSKTNCQVDSESEYVKAVHDLSKLSVNRILKIHQRSDFLYSLSKDGARYNEALKIVHRHSRNIIESRKKTMAASQGVNELLVESDDSIPDTERRRVDFLDILLTAKDADGIGMPDEDIKAEVDTFLFEGHDTTAAGISWILYLCAKYPELQEKMRDEVDAILVGRESDHMTWNDLSELKYTTLFIKEAMRLYPPVPIVSRCTEHDVQLGSYTVPKGTSVDILIYALHRNRHVWGDDVEEFKPERFALDDSDGSSSKGDKLSPFAYIPFSAGPRNCIGQNLAMNEVKVTVARLLRRFIVKPHPTIIPKPVFLLVLRTLETNPILLSLEPRAQLRG